jgi:hypothetical protein
MLSTRAFRVRRKMTLRRSLWWKPSGASKRPQRAGVSPLPFELCWDAHLDLHRCGLKRGLLVQAKRRHLRGGRWNQFTDTQLEKLPRRMAYAALLRYEFADAGGRKLKSFDWHPLSGHDIAVAAEWLRSGDFPNAVDTSAVVASLARVPPAGRNAHPPVAKLRPPRWSLRPRSSRVRPSPRSVCPGWQSILIRKDPSEPVEHTGAGTESLSSARRASRRPGGSARGRHLASQCHEPEGRRSRARAPLPSCSVSPCSRVCIPCDTMS